MAAVLGDLPAGKGLGAAARELREKSPDLPFLCLPESVDNSPELARGMAWKVELPFRRSQLVRLLVRAGRYKGQERRHRLTGCSRPIRRVRELIEQVADFDTSVLVTGESGTGTVLVARTIHELSDRADGPFVPINCGAIPAELLESELFGHKKGAFTGAISDRIGRFELADGGTLLLDQAENLSLEMQAAILQLIETRHIMRLQGTHPIPINVRIIMATTKDLERLVAKPILSVIPHHGKSGTTLVRRRAAIGPGTARSTALVAVSTPSAATILALRPLPSILPSTAPRQSSAMVKPAPIPRPLTRKSASSHVRLASRWTRGRSGSPSNAIGASVGGSWIR